jgi:hypothetical protein
MRAWCLMINVQRALHFVESFWRAEPAANWHCHSAVRPGCQCSGARLGRVFGRRRPAGCSRTLSFTCLISFASSCL